MNSQLFRKSILLLAVSIILLLCACHEQKTADFSKELPFTDITTGRSSWKIETCRLIVENSSATLQGRVRNTEQWPVTGLNIYFNLLDTNGESLVTTSCMTVLDTPVENQGTSGYVASIKNFFDFDKIESVTVEFGK